MGVASRPLVLSMLVVVSSFGASLWFSQYRLEPIHDDAVAIATNGTPAIEHLAAARGELLKVGIAATHLLFDPLERRPIARARIDEARRALAAEFEAYRRIPTRPGEEPVALEVKRDLEILDRSIEAMVAGLTSESTVAQRVESLQILEQRWEELSFDLQRLLDLNAASVRANTRTILTARANAARAALILGIFSLVAAVIATFIAFTTMRRSARLAEAHAHLLEARATELEAFSARVAHDLRNPLGAMALQVAASRARFKSDAKAEELFDGLTRRIQNMSRIIEDLLGFAQASGQSDGSDRTDLTAVVRDVALDMQPTLEASGSTLQIESECRVTVTCSEGALSSVIRNLIQNAIKYGGDGNPITLRSERLEHRVRVEVADLGPGIPAAQQAMIFEPFVRLQGSLPGLGLGLATVKRIVEGYGGSVGVESHAGRGSRFWFELPIAGESGDAGDRGDPDRLPNRDRQIQNCAR